MKIMKTKMFAALSTLILISVAVPAMAQDRGERHQRAGTYHQDRRDNRSGEVDRFLKPILALLHRQHGRRHETPRRHRHDHYRPGKYRHHDFHVRKFRGQKGRHGHRYFRSARRHQAWHRRNDRRHHRHGRHDRRRVNFTPQRIGKCYIAAYVEFAEGATWN